MENLLRDTKLAIKLLWKDWSFTATAILTLAMCIGANAAIFTIVEAVLLRPLPVPDADGILLMSNQYPKAGVADSLNSGVPDYYDRLKAVTVFDQQALFNYQSGGTIEITGKPESVQGMAATPSLFRLLQVKPLLGRTFLDSEGEIGSERKTILSYGLWQRLYGGDGKAVGRELRINDQPYTIIGVMPRSFSFMNPEVQLWTPLAFTAKQKSDEARHSNNWYDVGRLKPGATMQQAQAQVNSLNAANLERFPQFRDLLVNAGFHTRVERLQDVLVRNVRSGLYLLWGGAGFVLLIGGVNIANIVLARSTNRRKDLVTRLALGASRARIARYLVLESLELTLTAGAAGMVLAALILRTLRTLGLDRIPRANEIRLDAAAFVFAFGIAALVGVLIALVPSLDLFKLRLAAALQNEGRSGTGGKNRRAVRRLLVVAQVSFAFLLLIGAGLLLASFQRLLAVDPGFRPDGVVTASVVASMPKYAGNPEVRSFVDRALDAIRALPGVSAAGATTIIPLGGNHNDGVILAEGYVMKPGESLISPMHVRVTPGYFEAIGATLKRGRFFDARDSADGPRTVIVDEQLAHKFWLDADPIGRRMYRPESANDLLKVDEHTQWLTVVGVVGDIHMDDIKGNNTVGAYYFPYAQETSRFVTFAVKNRNNSESLINEVRSALGKIDPEMAMFDIRTLDDRMSLSLMPQRTAMLLAAAFALVALFLSALGVYGVLAYLVAQRRREIGIRIALGSSAGALFRMVVKEGAFLLAAGLIIGAAGAIGLRNVIGNQLYGVSPLDPIVIGIVVLILGAAGFIACALPARRAARVDPMRVLGT